MPIARYMKSYTDVNVMTLPWIIYPVRTEKDSFGWYSTARKSTFTLQSVNKNSSISRWINEGEIWKGTHKDGGNNCTTREDR